MLNVCMSQTACRPVCCCAALRLALTGCSQGNQEYNEGKKAEAIQDYDTAVVHYSARSRPIRRTSNTSSSSTACVSRPGRGHVEQGEKLRQQGDLQMALAEFQKAMLIDPSSPVAQQETQEHPGRHRRRNRPRQHRRPLPRPPRRKSPR